MAADESNYHIRQLASLRKRPAMYIGGTDFFGLVHYVVAAFDLMLDNAATFLNVQIGEAITIRSDALLPVTMNDHGDILPYEIVGSLESRRRRSPDAAILAGLSATFTLVSSDGQTQTELAFSTRERTRFTQSPAANSQRSVEITFVPDPDVFTVTDVSPHLLQCYCRRTSFLFPGVTIQLDTGTDAWKYHSSQGLRDYFDMAVAPYQILHQPIHLIETVGDLKLEAVFVFHSWSEAKLWSFANKGRVPDGGTHETGFFKGISDLNACTPDGCQNGLLGLLAIESPNITYEACIKARIVNPELVDMVSEAVSAAMRGWLAEHPAEREYLARIEQFRFAEEW